MDTKSKGDVYWGKSQFAYQNDLCTSIDLMLQDRLDTSIRINDTQEARTIYIGKIYGFNVDRYTVLQNKIIQEEMDNECWEELGFELLTTK